MADEKIPDPDKVNESTTATNELSESIKKLTKDASVLKSMMSDVNKEIRTNFEELVKSGKVTEETVETLNAYLDVKAKVIQAEKDGGTASEELTADLQLYKDMLDEIDPTLAKFADSLSEQAVAAAEADVATKALNKTLQGFSNVLSFANMGSLDFSGGLMSMANELKSAGLQFDEFNKSVEVLTGLGPQSAEISQDLVEAGKELGLTLDEANEAQGALNQSLKSFGLLSVTQQKEITKNVLAMERLGVSAEASGRAMDLFRFSMGGTDESAKDLLPRLDKLAVSLGLPTGQVVEDFNKLGPQLARFGKGAEAQFKKLASTARSLGLDVQAAFDIAEAVDTFEGAADMAGKLNAQLGLQINSVELLNADHNERINIMRREFQESGKGFDEMGRRQQQAVAEMMGVDVDTAARLFGDPMSYAEVDAERADALKRSEQLTTANKKLAAAGDRLLIALEPIATVLANIAVGIADFLAQPFIVFLITSTGLIYGLTKAFFALKAGLALLAAARQADTVSQAFKILMNKKEEVSNENLSDSMDKVSKGSSKTGGSFKTFAKNAKDLAKPLAALGFAVLALGAGIFLAAKGMALLVEAFAGVGENAMAAALGLGILIIPFVAFVAAAAFMAVTGVGFAAAGVLAAMGFGAMLLGAGIGLAAAGMSLFVESLKGLSEGEAASGIELLQELPPIMLAMVPSMALLALTGVKAAVGFAAFGVAALGVGVGMSYAAKGLSVAVPHLQSLQGLSLGSLSAELVSLALAIGVLGISLTGLALLLSSGVGAIGFTIAILALAGAFIVLGRSMSGIGDAAKAVSDASGGFDSLEKVIAVSTKVSSAELDNMERVMGAVVKVSEGSRAVEATGLDRLADSITNMLGGTSTETDNNKTVVLKVDERKLGEVVVNILNSNYGMRIAR